MKTIFDVHSLRNCFFFGLIILVANHVSAQPVDYVLPKAGQWEVDARPQDTVDLEEDDGVLKVRFTVKTDETFLSGNQFFHQARVKLCLKKPIQLDHNQKRVLFEARGMHLYERGPRGVLLLPLFRDKNGEELVYTPVNHEQLGGGRGKWMAYKTHSLYSTEAGGAATDSYLARGGDGNAWPDGQITFLGFELTIQTKAETIERGEIDFGGFALGGERMPDQDPYFFADAFLSGPGEYRIGLQVRRAFQDAPLREELKTIHFDPKKPSSALQKIFIELGPRGNYWINYQITAADGKIVANEQLRAWVEDGTATSTPKTLVDLKTPPATSYLRINPGRPGNGVYRRDAKPELNIRAFSKGNSSYQVSWRVERYAFPELVAEGRQTIRFGQDTYTDFTISPELPLECDAYRLKVEVAADGGAVLDRQDYLFGRETGPIQRYKNRNGKRITREQVKQSPYLRMTYSPYRNNKKIEFASRQAYIDRFTAALKEIAQVTPNVTVSWDIRNFEVLPGVFDFDLLDQVLDAATDQNCRLTIRMDHADAYGVLHWQRYWPQRSYDGTIGPYRGFDGSFSPADEEYSDGLLRAFKALHDRYVEHPAFQGYQLFELSGEWAVLDRPYAGSIVTYEKCARPLFVRYLKDHVTAELAELNLRWGTAYQSWGDVKQPQPNLESGSKPDLRPQWIDFCRFKHYLNNEYWYRRAAESIRSYDPDSVLMVYRQDPGGFEDVGGFAGIDFFHGAGNNELEGEGSLIDAWQKHRIGWITEPHHPHRWASHGDPGYKGWILDWTTYIMLAQAGGGGANMHVYYWPLPGKADLFLPAHYGSEYAIDRWEKWQPLLREMHGVELKQNRPQVAVTQDILTLFCKHRTVFLARTFDLRRWFDLLKTDAVGFEDYRKANHDAYKLILPNLLDQVMSGENIGRLGDFVRAGGKTVISAETGRYCPDRPNTPFALLAELGIRPPMHEFNTSAEKIEARIVADNPFFAGARSVPFFSVGDMKRELRSPEMKDRFSQWPYRWLPQTDYFGHFPGVKNVEGRVLARFADGGVALSLHPCGKGEVLVFWGCPDYSAPELKGFMQNVAKWAGVDLSRQDSPVPLTMEADHSFLERHYAIMWQDIPGTYKQKLPMVPEGKFFLDDLVSGQRLGVHTSDELRNGIPLTWIPGLSPLKILRMIPYKHMGAYWVDAYNSPGNVAETK